MTEKTEKIYRNLINVVRKVTDSGSFLSGWVRNPKPAKEDGTADKYHEGFLVWYDAKLGKKFLVKSFGISDKITDNMRNSGIKNVLYIDLANEYHVEELA